jgi:hypothetical protein
MRAGLALRGFLKADSLCNAGFSAPPRFDDTFRTRCGRSEGHIPGSDEMLTVERS